MAKKPCADFRMRIRVYAGDRMLGPGKIATTELDPNAIQLLTEWITQELPGRLSFPQWQVQYFGSTGNPNAAADADPDRDGHNNFEEFHTYTNPTMASSAPAQPQGSLVNGGSEVRFQYSHPANRAVLIETSTDATNWTLWMSQEICPTTRRWRRPAACSPRSTAILAVSFASDCRRRNSLRYGNRFPARNLSRWISPATRTG